MRGKLKLIGIIVLAAIIGFGMAACDLDPCATNGHDWGNGWDTSKDPSIRVCKVCDTVEECPCTDIVSWTQFLTTAEANGTCRNCQGNVKLAKKHFYGKWEGPLSTGSDVKQTIELSENQFKISNSNGEHEWKMTSIQWAAAASSSDKTGDYSKENFPVGFKITGTCSYVGTTWTTSNDNISVFMSKNTGKIVMCLSTTYYERIYTLVKVDDDEE